MGNLFGSRVILHSNFLPVFIFTDLTKICRTTGEHGYNAFLAVKHISSFKKKRYIYTSEGAKTPSRMSTLNLDLELRRKTLKGAGIFPGFKSCSSRGTSTKHCVGPHAMDSRSGLTIGPMLVAIIVTCSRGSTLPFTEQKGR